MGGKVAFAGDWHGNKQWAKRVLNALHEENVSTIYHVGDFGLWPGNSGKKYLHELHKVLVNNDQIVYITLGNHEDYSRVQFMKPVLDGDGWLALTAYPRLRFAPRAHVWVAEDGTRYASLGGAGSIDRNLRTENVDWWAEEELLSTDVHTLTELVAEQGWDKVDVFISHECPAGVRMIGFDTMPVWATHDIQHYCYLQRVRLREAVDVVTPTVLFHGHWHNSGVQVLQGVSAEGEDYETVINSLNMDGRRWNTVTADVSAGVVSNVTELPWELIWRNL